MATSSSSSRTYLSLLVRKTENARVVQRDFWRKFLKFAARLPFAEDLAAAYFCAVDPVTPNRVKGVLMAAIAYFIIPFDAIPDFVAGLGFTDDAAVLGMAIRLVAKHIKPQHYDRARAALKVAAEIEGETANATR